MKFSYNWLREYVADLDTPARELESLITMKTAECEGIERVGALLDEACAARVEQVEPIAGNHNVKATVDAGRYGLKTVVCGAPNCRPGMISVYAPVGKKTIHGVESDGMLAAGAELGLNRDTAGILELESQVGAPVPGCGPDTVIEIDNKSITHRPDLWGHFGMAREIAAITRKRLLDPVNMELLPGGAPPIQIAVEDPELCPRYSALVFENVTVRPSPLWLQYRLSAIGSNPINNIVDMTNYIMAELAQPMHAFDQALLHGDTISIRPARPGETLTALNECQYALEPSNLVIADGKGPVALAGVIGGMETAITEKTSRIVLESANFQAAGVRRTSVALKLRTDASMRFEKSQDPANTVRALARAVELLAQLSPGARLVTGLADRKREIPAPPPIEFPVDWAIRKLGRSVDPHEIRDILDRLEFGVSEKAPRVFQVTVPSWRATKDVSMKDDLVEEVGRMIGYDSIKPTAPAVLATVPPCDETRAFHRQVRGMLAAQGFTEVYNYSFVSEEQVRLFGLDPSDHLAVANPIASDQSLMRVSLIPGIFKNIVENSRHFERFRLFELGREIHMLSGNELPDEIPHLAAAIFARDDGKAGLFELKRVAECLMRDAAARPVAARPFEHPTRTAEVVWQGKTTGRLFELHPSLLAGNGRAAILDLDLREVENLREATRRYTPVRRFPSSEFDLSVIAGTRELAGDLRDKLAGFAGPMLERIEYLREYRGDPLPENAKSVSFRLTVGAGNRTLSAEDVAAVRSAIIECMRSLGYDLRI